jgi:hypothetical protein
MLPHRPRNRSSSHGDREPKFAQPRSQPRMPAAQLSKARIDVDSRDQMPSRSRERSRDAQDRVGCRLLAGRTTWTAGAAGRGRSSRSPGSAAATRGESPVRVMRSDCQATACRGECNQDEVLVAAYCGARRGPVVNERTAICVRGAATSPLVMVCVKATP